MLGQVVKVVAERTYGQDEQVMISYGLKSSAECLEDHGTVPDIDMDEGQSSTTSTLYRSTSISLSSRELCRVV